MRLLFDENLSHRLVDMLADLFPDSVHVRNVGLSSADDLDVARYAAVNDLVIVTKDVDFEEIGLAAATVARVVRLDTGNASTSDIERLLRAVASDLDDATFETSRIVIVSHPRTE